MFEVIPDKEVSIQEMIAQIRNELVLPLVLLEKSGRDANSECKEVKDAVACISRICNLLSQINSRVKSLPDVITKNPETS